MPSAGTQGTTSSGISPRATPGTKRANHSVAAAAAERGEEAPGARRGVVGPGSATPAHTKRGIGPSCGVARSERSKATSST